MLLFILLNIGLGVVEFYTLWTAPMLVVNPAWPFLSIMFALQQIEYLPLESTFLRSFPEFTFPSDEAHWWQLQTQLYRLLRRQDTVRVVWTDPQGGIRSEQARVGTMPLTEVIERT